MALPRRILSLLLAANLLLTAANASAQSTDTTADGLFQSARKAAFDNNDYSRAKQYLFRALAKAPNYVDVRIFLGRIYTWTKNYDSARLSFSQALALKPDYEDGLVASSDLEYFDGKYERSLEIVRGGLQSNPASEPLMFREARALDALKRRDEAERAVRKLLLLSPDHPEGKALFSSILAGRRAPVTPPVTTVATANANSTSSDQLLIAARKAAFDDKNYAQAKQYLYQALQQSPDYADVKIFLGRIFTWTNQPDSARYYFSGVLGTRPDYEDAALASADLEYWNDNNARSLEVIESSLKYHPASEALLFRKARALNAMRRYEAAESAVHQVLLINRSNSEARLLAERIKELATRNKIGFSYDFIYFDKQFSDPWHLLSFNYTRRTGIGSVTGRINYANRFKEGGVQYELEAYPRFSKTFYSYMSIGYSDKVGVFPAWRGGFSLYINLPKSYEGELGFRYLKFSGNPTWIYTAYLGKYYKSWLFGLRTYITPSSSSSSISSSYNVSARYYYGSADDVLGFNLGYGISPDDRITSVQLDNPVKLITYKAGLLFKKKISKFSVLSLDGSYYNQEYLPNTKGNQYQFSIGWLYRF
jgi:YaiO family outer membrane protein